jgi:thiol:disulfide interchange protein/DsbC/DsbD-like thiol-disulfide interchange protein
VIRPDHSRKPIRLLAAATLAIACVTSALAAPVTTGHVTAELVADQTALVPGATTTIALRLDIEPGWHTYWRNPGESGLPTTLAWRLPAGYAAGDIEWPAPRTLPAGPLVNYGYEKQVLHLVPITVPSDARPGTEAQLAARADWLVCKETCIPEGADLTMTLPVAARADDDARWHDAIARTRDALPSPMPAAWNARAVAAGSVITVQFNPGSAGDPGRVHFFAEREGRIEPSAPQQVTRSDGGIELKLPVAHDLADGFTRLQGVLTAERGLDMGGTSRRAFALDVALQGTPSAGPQAVQPATSVDFASSPASARALSLPVALAFAFAGGLLLNLMPCVLPVLSIKALALAAYGTVDRAMMRREALAFGAGVLVTFVALAVVIIGLRTAGEQLGWGFQLQSPAVVTALTVLFFVMALNLSGVFEFRALLPSGLATWSHANRTANAFASGALAVAIASPCTAPFMGAALGYALGESGHVTLGVFAALGLGMALPYVALAWFPGWRSVLPRPGAWMVRLRQLLAFPLYATVAWLVWVLGAQVGNDAVIRIGGVLVALAFALWAWHAWRGGGRGLWGAMAAVGMVFGAVIAWPLLSGGDRVATTADDAPTRVSRDASDAWEPYSASRLTELVAEGRPVFVDFTAAWCITCQVNKRLVLTDARVRDAFASRGVALLRADWTRRDPAITQALAALGRSGVPVYVLYGKAGTATLLPEVLQRQPLIDAIDAS